MGSKVVLVTGGSSGIGLAICKYLHQQGHLVYGTSRKVESAHQNVEFTLVQLKLDDEDDILRVVDKILAKEGRIDVLVNNAGLGMAGAIEDASTAEVEQLFKTNVFGQLACCRAVIPGMRKQRSGKIINISSIAGEFGLPYRGVYSATKSAIDRLSETLRMELARWDIHVSIVQPGDFKTAINQNRLVAANSQKEFSPYREGFEKQYKRISEDVAAAHDPLLVARVVAKIIHSKNPRMRYPVATFYQRLSLSLNRVLPVHIFQKMLVLRYPVH